MTPRRFKCSQFRKDTLDFNFECIKMLQNDFCKQLYKLFNATISDQDRIYPKTHLCRTFLLSIYAIKRACSWIYSQFPTKLREISATFVWQEKRSFQDSWFTNRTSLHYDDAYDLTFCMVAYKDGKPNSTNLDKVFIINGFSN